MLCFRQQIVRMLKFCFVPWRYLEGNNIFLLIHLQRVFLYCAVSWHICWCFHTTLGIFSSTCNIFVFKLCIWAIFHKFACLLLSTPSTAWSQYCLVAVLPGHSTSWSQYCLVTVQPGNSTAWSQYCLVIVLPGHSTAWSQYYLVTGKKCKNSLGICFATLECYLQLGIKTTANILIFGGESPYALHLV